MKLCFITDSIIPAYSEPEKVFSDYTAAETIDRADISRPQQKLLTAVKIIRRFL